MKHYRPSPAVVHQEEDYYVLQHKTRSKIGKRVHQVAHQESTGLKESPYMSSRMLKRSSPYSSTVLEAHTVNTQKMKAVEVEGKRRRVQPITFRRKVDNVAYVGGNLGDKFTQRSSYNGLSGHGYMDRAKLDIAGNPEQNDSDDDASSVGSCSVNTMRIDKFFNCSFAAPCQDWELNSSDAESFCHSLDEEEDNVEENVEVSIHTLELQAFRCTLEALYASGPLSWEKELLLTNLRIMLHISNDEHLSELRNLIVR